MSVPAQNIPLKNLLSKGIQTFQSGDREAGLEALRQAVLMAPQDANCASALGQALYFSGQMKEARQQLSRAVTLDENLTPAWQHLGLACLELGDVQIACEALARAVSQNRDDLKTMQLFMQTFTQVRFKVFSEWIKNVLIFCLKRDHVNHQLIADAWMHFFNIDPAFEDIRALYKDESPKQIPGGLNDLYLNLALQRMYVCSMDFENAMTRLRRLFLTQLSEKKIKAADYDVFLCSLATQCWLNEYLYDFTPAEEKQLSALKQRLEKKPEENDEYMALLCLYACYAPLLTLKNAPEIFEKLGSSGFAAFRMMLKSQIADPLEENEIKKTIFSREAITNDTSLAVQAQYEENPYPRWKYTYKSESKPDEIDILIAGCGTGSHTAICASLFPNAKIHNVDLSRTSLAYAIRQTRELGYANLTFEHADILSLDTAAKQYDRIESIGVIHHMKEPEKGLAVLTKLLKPGGHMVLGLYAESGRKDISYTRDYLAKKKYGTTPADMRRIRKEIASHSDPMISACSRKTDFFSMSTFRDLILHVQEHRYTLAQIEEMLAAENLEFVEFDFVTKRPLQLFREKFTGPDDEKDLNKWAVLEEAHPGFFAGFYVFHARHKN